MVGRKSFNNAYEERGKIMKKNIVLGIIGLLLFPSCTQIKGSFDPAKIATYSTEITLGVKYATKFVLKNENLTKSQLIEIKYYLTLAQQTIDLNKAVIFVDINAIMENKIQDQKIKILVQFVLTNVEKYVNSYNLVLPPQDINIIKITQAALSGAISGVSELLNVS